VAKPEIQFVGPVLDRRPKPPRNGYGKWGFLVTLLSCGVLAPLGLLLSVRGLFSRPRTLAVLGTMMNGAICTFVFLPAGIHIAEHAERQHRRHQAHMAQQHQQDSVAVAELIAQANVRINEYVKASQGALPEGVAGNKLLADCNDLWEQPLRYEVPLDMSATTYTIRSAGRDRKFETGDDIQVDYSTPASRNDAGIPTSTPTVAPSEDSPVIEAPPVGQSLRRIEVLDRQSRTYIVVVNR
jgi:hypothetical protein